MHDKVASYAQLGGWRREPHLLPSNAADTRLFVVRGPSVAGGACRTRSYGHGSVVCVCDGSQCGALASPPRPGGPGPGPEDGSATPFELFTSSKAGLRLRRDEGNFTNAYARAKGQTGKIHCNMGGSYT